MKHNYTTDQWNRREIVVSFGFSSWLIHSVSAGFVSWVYRLSMNQVLSACVRTVLSMLKCGVSASNEFIRTPYTRLPADSDAQLLTNGNGNTAGLLYPLAATLLMPKMTLSLLNLTVVVRTFPTGI